MKERYSSLKPLEGKDLLCWAITICHFFDVKNNIKHRGDLGLPIDEKMTLPLSFNDFLNYMQKKTNIDAGRLNSVFYNIINRLEAGSILIRCDGASSGSPPFCQTYYFMKELTALQQKNYLWLADSLGLGFLQYLAEDYTIHLTGKDEDGNHRNGTGILITSKHILTCKHNIEDMTIDKHITYKGKNYEILCTKKHPNLDFAILYLNFDVSPYHEIGINDVSVLSEVVVLGFPPIPMSDNGYILSLRGEVNSIITDYVEKQMCLVLSSTVRPGNSGGPVFSKDGYLVGMVMRMNEISGSSDENATSAGIVEPYYMAYHGKVLHRAIMDIDETIDIKFEDYQ